MEEDMGPGEKAVLLALYEHGTAHVDTLAEILGMHSEQVEAHLESLVQRGFVAPDDSPE